MDILDIFYPKRCISCKQSGKYICNKCLEKMISSKQICYKCRNFSKDGKTHTYCKKTLDLDGIYSLWKYHGVIGQAIKKIKYQFISDLAEEIVNEFAVRYQKQPLQLDNFVLTPIPLHPARYRWRGYNQSELLGKQLAKKLNWHFEPNLLVRNKNTKPQVELSGKRRKENVKNIFSLNPKSKLNINNQSLIIFDDITTTSSTLHEAGKVLKKHGAKTVWGMTIAS